MRVVLSTWGSRGDVEPPAGLAVRLRELGAEVRVCAPPDEEFAELLARVGVELAPLGPTVRSVVTGERPPSAAAAFRLAPELVAARFDTLAAAAEGCDALLATGLPPVASVRDHVLTDRAWPAADPVLDPWQDMTDLDLVETGAWFPARTAAACSSPAAGPAWP